MVLTPAAQDAPRPVGVQALGPQVGERVPDFRLQDITGKSWTLESIMGPEGALIVFSRSADWCPYCKTQMIEMQGRLPELAAQGLGLAAITYDSPAILADFARRQNISFPLLSDPGSATIRQYGILNTTVDPASSNYGIPFPGTFLVDRQGIVTARFFEEAYQERTTVSNILLQLGSQPGATTAASRIETNHLVATAYASDPVVAPGTLFSLVVDVEPKPRMHLYAPGAQSYRVIDLQLAPNPLLVTRPMRYPGSEIYFFEPLNEHVPVFQKPFRLALDVALDSSREAREALATVKSLTIDGTLDYQACDDAVCFLPTSVPVSFTVQVRPLDTQRASPR